MPAYRYLDACNRILFGFASDIYTKHGRNNSQSNQG